VAAAAPHESLFRWTARVVCEMWYALRIEGRVQ
jgi:hypothetical protein